MGTPRQEPSATGDAHSAPTDILSPSLPPRYEALLARVSRLRLLPVVTIDDPQQAVGLGAALLAGGLPIAEVTFRTAAAADALRAMVEAGQAPRDGSGLLLGAGTVITPGQVDTAVAAGARFIVSPGLSRAVVDRCAEHDVPVVPGVATATEIQTALTWGLRLMKFFPAGVYGGPAAIRALSGPFPQVRFIPTGGVTEANLADYLALPPVVGVGGSWMVPAGALAAGDLGRIEALSAAAVRAAQGVAP